MAAGVGDGDLLLACEGDEGRPPARETNAGRLRGRRPPVADEEYEGQPPARKTKERLRKAARERIRRKAVGERWRRAGVGDVAGGGRPSLHPVVHKPSPAVAEEENRGGHGASFSSEEADEGAAGRMPHNIEGQDSDLVGGPYD
ncbi:unnamed protein product [Urochloa humidicola]